MQKGDRVGILAEQGRGNLTLYINEQVVSEIPAAVDTYQPLYGLVDLCDCATRSVTLVEPRTPPRAREVKERVGVIFQRQLDFMRKACEKPLGPEADVYSAGMVAWQCFNGGLALPWSSGLRRLLLSFLAWMGHGRPEAYRVPDVLLGLHQYQSEEHDLSNIRHEGVRGVLQRTVSKREAAFTDCADLRRALAEQTGWVPLAATFLKSHEQVIASDDGSKVWDVSSWKLGSSHVRRILDIMQAPEHKHEINVLQVASFAQLPPDVLIQFALAFSHGDLHEEHVSEKRRSTIRQNRRSTVQATVVDARPKLRFVPGRQSAAAQSATDRLPVADGSPLWHDIRTNFAVIVLHFVQRLDLSTQKESPIGCEGAKLIACGLWENRMLVYLDVSGQQIADDGAEALAQAIQHGSGLETLNLSSNKIGLAASTFADVLKESKYLKELDLSATGLGDGDAVKLANGLGRNEVLEVLRLERNDLTHEGGLAMGEMMMLNMRLHTLALGRNEIGRAAAALFYASKLNPQLKRLSIQGNALGIFGAESISRIFTDDLPSIEELNLRCCSLNSSGVVEMFEAVACRSHLRSLNLAWNEVGSLGGTTIATVLLTPACHLTELDLRDNRLGDCAAFAKRLFQCAQDPNARNNQLQRLHLGNNRLDAESTVPLANAIPAFLALQDLALYGNPQLGADAASHIGQVLQFKRATQLASLNFSMCMLGDGGARALAECLHSNPVLTRLNLSQNCITDKCIMSFVTLLSTNRTLEHLDLSFNSVSLRGLTSIVEEMKKGNMGACQIRLHANPCAVHVEQKFDRAGLPKPIVL